MTELSSALDAEMTHTKVVDAPLATTWRALESIDMRSSRVVRTLLTARGLRPKRPLTLERIGGSDFRLVSRQPPQDKSAGSAKIVLGLIAKPWKLRGSIDRTPVEDLAEFDTPGYAVVTWSYLLEGLGQATKVTTRTAVRCTDDESRRRFRWYWRVVGPFSSLIRRESLRLLESAAVREHSSGTVD